MWTKRLGEAERIRRRTAVAVPFSEREEQHADEPCSGSDGAEGSSGDSSDTDGGELLRIQANAIARSADSEARNWFIRSRRGHRGLLSDAPRLYAEHQEMVRRRAVKKPRVIAIDPPQLPPYHPLDHIHNSDTLWDLNTLPADGYHYVFPNQ